MELNTLEHLQQRHQQQQQQALHHQMDQMAAGVNTQMPAMIGYDPAQGVSNNMHMHMNMNHNMALGDDGDQPVADLMLGGMMKMYFHFGLGDMVLWRGLVLDSHTKLWLTCLALFLCALLLELIDYSRGYLSCRCRESALAKQRAQRGREGAKLSSATTTTTTTCGDDDGQQGPGAGEAQPAAWSCCAGSATPGESYGTWRAENGGAGPAAAAAAKDPAAGLVPRFFPVRAPHEPQSHRLLQASLQFVRTGLSLCLMLVAMTYNLCLIFAILLGSAVGFYVFYRPALDSKSVVCH